MTDKQTNQDPIAHAARLLREAAEELRQAHAYNNSEGWQNETDAKAAYDEHLAAAQALEDWEAAVGAGGVQPLRPEGGPPGSGGWKAHAENLERERDHWRERAQTMYEHQRGEVWYWQGDGTDHLESMVNRLPVVIRADQLRALSSAKVPPAYPAMPENWGVVASVNGENILCIGDSYLHGKRELSDAEEQAIVGMAQHLLAFVGYGLPPSSFDPDADEAPQQEATAAPHKAPAESEQDLRTRFEALARDSYNFKRSRRDCYVNPATARDWKWFRLGATVAAQGGQ